MFSHIVVGSNDLERSRRFYDATFAALGAAAGTTDAKGRLVYSKDGCRLLVTKPIDGKPATSVITDRNWLENTFVPLNQERGKFIIDTTKVSSSFSAANGAIDHVKSLVRGTPAGDWTSAALVSKGEYGVPAGLVFGYPVTASGDGNWKVVEGLKFDEYGQKKFKTTLDELLQEREVVKDLLPG